MERRTLIRLLVLFGIGIPLLVEGITFLGLIDAKLLGGGDTTPTPSVEGATQGDEILRGTTPTETLTTASLAESGDLTLTVRVENTGNWTYELRLRNVTTRGGEIVAVEGNATTGAIAPGESGFASGQWALPADARPASVTVVAITVRDGDPVRIERSVALGRL